MKKKLFPLAVLLFSSAFAISQPTGMQKPPSPEERLNHLGERLDKELQLTSDQKQKVLAAYKDFFTKVDEIVAKNPPPPPPPPPPISKEEMDKLVTERNSQVKAVLNDEQYKKFEEMEKKRRPGHMGKPGKNGPPPPPKTPPTTK